MSKEFSILIDFSFRELHKKNEADGIDENTKNKIVKKVSELNGIIEKQFSKEINNVVKYGLMVRIVGIVNISEVVRFLHYELGDIKKADLIKTNLRERFGIKLLEVKNDN